MQKLWLLCAISANIRWERALNLWAEAKQKTCSSDCNASAPERTEAHQAVSIISLKSIQIIRQEVFANEEAILVFLAGSKLNGEMGENGKGVLTGKGKRRINTKAD